MAGDVGVHAAAELFGAEQRVHHPHHLGALLVDRRGVEIVDRDVAVRPHGVGERAVILGELRRAQPPHVGEPLDRAAALVGGELLVAEDRQPLLQRELEPVAAGDAVAGPVVEILVRDDGFYSLIVHVGRRLRLGQHVFRVEDIEPLVLHRAHVEVRHGGDVEHVEVVFQAESVLVPFHRRLERQHRVVAAVLVAAPHPDAEVDVPAGAGGEAVAHRHEVAGDQGEQVARLRVRIDPARPVAAVAGIARCLRIAVGEQHRAGATVGDQRHGVARHHVRAVGEVGDAAEAFGLALGEEVAAGDVQAAELGVLVRRDPGFGFQHAGVRQVGDGQAIRRQRERVGRQVSAVEAQCEQRQRLAVEPQRRLRVAMRGVAPQCQTRAHHGRRGIEVEVQFDGIDQERRRPVGLAPHGGRGRIVLAVVHEASSGRAVWVPALCRRTGAAPAGFCRRPDHAAVPATARSAGRISGRRRCR